MFAEGRRKQGGAERWWINAGSFLRHRHFHALALCTSFCMALLAGRVWYSQSLRYSFLVWNLFLAWVPYGCSLAVDCVAEHRPRWWLLLPLTALWLMFLPNAPYILTDFIHLRHIKSNSLWFDLMLLSAFAGTGCLLGFGSLHILHVRLRQHVSPWLGWLLVLVVFGLTGAGVYVGRFLRWNSWDVLTNPHGLASCIVDALFHPRAHRHAMAFTALFAAFLTAVYLTLTSIRQPSMRLRGKTAA